MGSEQSWTSIERSQGNSHNEESEYEILEEAKWECSGGEQEENSYGWGPGGTRDSEEMTGELCECQVKSHGWESKAEKPEEELRGNSQPWDFT